MSDKPSQWILDQIEAARKGVSQRPGWMKSVAHFSGPQIEAKIPKKSQDAENAAATDQKTSSSG